MQIACRQVQSDQLSLLHVICKPVCALYGRWQCQQKMHMYVAHAYMLPYPCPVGVASCHHAESHYLQPCSNTAWYETLLSQSNDKQ